LARLGRAGATFRMIVEGRELLLEAGDALAIPRGTVHSAEVVGDQAVLVWTGRGVRRSGLVGIVPLLS
jgi:mannose-6-phosphate isomerase-like protein (cupin superfamily)